MSGLRRRGLLLFRVAVVAAAALALRAPSPFPGVASPPRVGPEEVRRFFPTADRLGQGEAVRASRTVLDAAGTVLGYVAQTSPQSDSITGYCGPSNLLIAFDGANRVVGLEVISSEDTPEHVALVARDETFARAFTGAAWGREASELRVDGVSGATLTSLAMASAVVRRLSGTRPSYRFPKPISLEEARRFLPAAARLESLPRRSGLFSVRSPAGTEIGLALRTSPHADDLVGYQGPSDTLLVFDERGRLLGHSIRASYESEEYLARVREDREFAALLRGRSLSELAALDLEAEEIEGVSGATMTSLTVVEGITRAAREALAPPASAAMPRMTARGSDLVTLLLLAAAVAVALTPLRRRPRVRLALQIALVGWLGLWRGDLLGLELLVGWARHGVPWRFAPSLALLAIAALALPVATGRQVYCHHVCPHGALQERLRARRRWQLRIPRRVVRLLRAIPFGLLMVAVAATAAEWGVDLAALEPFDAYHFRVAGIASLVLAAAGLLASLFVPMAYCRFGCPTGALLDYARRRKGRRRLSRADIAAIALLLIAWLLR